MEISRIIKNLESVFEKDKIKKSHYETLDDLLNELEKKQKKIESKLDAEKKKEKRKKLKMRLKIVEVQLKKGYRKRDALKGS